MDDNILDDVLFDDDEYSEGEENEIFDIKERKARWSEPFNQTDRDKMSIDNVFEDRQIQNLKHPPIMTQRTVATVSASAPQIFTLKDGIPKKQNILHEELNTTPAAKRIRPSEDFKTSIIEHKPQTRFTIHRPKLTQWMLDKQVTEKQPNKTDGVSLDSETIKINLLHPKNVCVNESSPNMVEYVQEDNSIIGTLPHTSFLKKLAVKTNDDTRKKNLKNVYGSFTTISSISFDSFLSPDTPKLVIGNPTSASKRILITVGIHGDEPCGIIAFNELLNESFFANLPEDISVSKI